MSEQLTHHRCREMAEALQELDEAVLRELGPRYTDEPWAARHFLHELPQKWRCSQVSLLADRRVAGFWIASASADSEVGVYTHRVALAPALRGSGVAAAMLAEVKAAAHELGCPVLTLSVGLSNGRAVGFYERAGFRRLEGEVLARFLRARGIEGVTVHSASFTRLATGFEKAALCLNL